MVTTFKTAARRPSTTSSDAAGFFPKKHYLNRNNSPKCIGHENIVFSLGVKLLCLLLVAVGVANMWMGIFADVGVMVLAVLNAIRALRVQDLKK